MNGFPVEGNRKDRPHQPLSKMTCRYQENLTTPQLFLLLVVSPAVKDCSASFRNSASNGKFACTENFSFKNVLHTLQKPK